jgi:hypothetical protein
MASSPSSEQLRRWAEYYRKAAEQFDAAADVIEKIETGEMFTRAPRPTPPVAPAPRPMSRLEQLREWVRTNGPIARRHIIRDSGIPTGTIGMLLIAQNGFRQDSDGRWFVPEPEEDSSQVDGE